MTLDRTPERNLPVLSGVSSICCRSRTETLSGDTTPSYALVIWSLLSCFFFASCHDNLWVPHFLVADLKRRCIRLTTLSGIRVDWSCEKFATLGSTLPLLARARSVRTASELVKRQGTYSVAFGADRFDDQQLFGPSYLLPPCRKTNKRSSAGDSLTSYSSRKHVCISPSFSSTRSRTTRQTPCFSTSASLRHFRETRPCITQVAPLATKGSGGRVKARRNNQHRNVF